MSSGKIKNFPFKKLANPNPSERIKAIKMLNSSDLDSNFILSILIGFAINDSNKEVALSAYSELVNEYDPKGTTFLLDFFIFGISDKRNDDERRLRILEKLHGLLQDKDPLKTKDILMPIFERCKGEEIGEEIKMFLENNGISVWEKDVFISHSKNDKKIVNKLDEYLKYKGVSTWIYDIDSEIGDPIAELSIKIQRCKYFLLILSESSIKSPVVKFEIEKAIYFKMYSKIKNILPVLYGKITEKEIPDSIKDHWFVDIRKPATKSYKQKFEKIASVILK